MPRRTPSPLPPATLANPAHVGLAHTVAAALAEAHATLAELNARIALRPHLAEPFQEPPLDARFGSPSRPIEHEALSAEIAARATLTARCDGLLARTEAPLAALRTAITERAVGHASEVLHPLYATLDAATEGGALPYRHADRVIAPLLELLALVPGARAHDLRWLSARFGLLNALTGDTAQRPLDALLQHPASGPEVWDTLWQALCTVDVRMRFGANAMYEAVLRAKGRLRDPAIAGWVSRTVVSTRGHDGLQLATSAALELVPRGPAEMVAMVWAHLCATDPAGLVRVLAHTPRARQRQISTEQWQALLAAALAAPERETRVQALRLAGTWQQRASQRVPDPEAARGAEGASPEGGPVSLAVGGRPTGVPAVTRVTR